MQENLVIVESPAKAKTIEKFLGKDFVVKSSFGHIRDLSKKDLGVNLDKDYEPVYEIPSDKRKVVEELSSLAKKTKTVWLASDEDREGEAIAWHLAEVLGLPIDQTKRIVFHEITKPAILAAIESPRTIDMNLVNAQQARRVLDRLVGFELSPLLWKKVRPQLSAGRVQSVAVRLLVEREREIIAFRSTPYYHSSTPPPIPIKPFSRRNCPPASIPARKQRLSCAAASTPGSPSPKPRKNRHSATPRLRSRPRRSSRRRAANSECRYRRRCPWRSTSTSRV